MVRMQWLTKNEPVQVVGQNISVESNHTYIWPVSSKVQLILHNKVMSERCSPSYMEPPAAPQCPGHLPSCCQSTETHQLKWEYEDMKTCAHALCCVLINARSRQNIFNRGDYAIELQVLWNGFTKNGQADPKNDTNNTTASCDFIQLMRLMTGSPKQHNRKWAQRRKDDKES